MLIDDAFTPSLLEAIQIFSKPFHQLFLIGSIEGFDPLNIKVDDVNAESFLSALRRAESTLSLGFIYCKMGFTYFLLKTVIPASLKR